MRHPRTYFAFGAFLALTIYLPGLSGPFLFDDGHAVVNNPSLELANLSVDALLDAAYSTNTGPLRRPVAMLTLAFNRSVFGPDPFSFKVLNLAIHIVNGTLIFALLRLLLVRMTDNKTGVLIASLTACVWLCHPIQLSSVLYVVQRMTSLSVLFQLLSMLAFCRLRADMIDRGLFNWSAALGIVAASVLALLSKETALLLPLYLLLFEYFVFKGAGLPCSSRTLWVSVVGVVALGALYVFLRLDRFAVGYGIRDFTMFERVLTEARVVALYIKLIVLPSLADFALYHDDIAISKSVWQPLSTLFAIAFLAFLLGLAVVVRRTRPVVALGLMWFFVGHLLESTIYPLEIAHEHRNYLASVGIIVAVLWVFHQFARHFLRPRIQLPMMFCLVAVCAFTTHVRASNWANDILLTDFEQHNHPTSSRANYEWARVRYELYKKTGNREYLLEANEGFKVSLEFAYPDTRALAVTALIETSRGPARDVLIDQAAQRLRAAHVNGREIAFLHLPAQCQILMGCEPDPEYVLKLAGALLDNESLTIAHRRTILKLLLVYYAQVLNDHTVALEIATDLHEERPEDIWARLRLAELLLLLGDKSRASRLVESAEAEAGWSERIADRELNSKLKQVRHTLNTSP
ncbi:MAG: tetratricopeptide repeat protein [Pseudomonadota bacterium]